MRANATRAVERRYQVLAQARLYLTAAAPTRSRALEYVEEFARELVGESVWLDSEAYKARYEAVVEEMDADPDRIVVNDYPFKRYLREAEASMLLDAPVRVIVFVEIDAVLRVDVDANRADKAVREAERLLHRAPSYELDMDTVRITLPEDADVGLARATIQRTPMKVKRG